VVSNNYVAGQKYKNFPSSFIQKTMYVCLLQPIDKLITVLSIIIIISLAISLIIISYKLLHSAERSDYARNITKIFLAFRLIEINYYCITIKMEDTSAIIQGNFSSIICFFKYKRLLSNYVLVKIR